MMLSKEEYLVGIYKIFGVALATPFGKFFLTLPDMRFENITPPILAYFLIAFVLFIIGIVLLISGYDIVYVKGERYKWIRK